MSYFITNSNQGELCERLKTLINASRELKFLVGFFYFSGLKELYAGLKENQNVIMKVLVGLNVDRTNYGLIEYADPETSLTDNERTQRFFESIKKSINCDYFDNKDFYEQARFFIELIRSNRLIVRKTFEPNHSKLYIFKLDKSQVGRDSLFITGSSNLTSAGLSRQNEFNVEISDYGVERAEEYYDNLWNSGVIITEEDAIRLRFIELLQKETLIRELTPYEAYVLVLKNYLETFNQSDRKEDVDSILNRAKFFPYRYQTDAIKQALKIIEVNNGVIIADVVGLGKTVIACAVAVLLKKRGIVLCPPGLIGERGVQGSGWKQYLESFGLNDWEVESIGNLDSEDFVQKIKNLRNIEVVIVDEAHRFRNEDTRSYEALKNICRNRIVILLTATPFNNRPSDILSLLKLFIIPKKSNISCTDNLLDKFRSYKVLFDKLGYIKKYQNDNSRTNTVLRYNKELFGDENIDLKRIKQRTHYLAKEIRSIIEPVTIRRNRLDLQNNPFYKEEIKELTKVSDKPEECLYELTKEQSIFYDEVIKSFDSPEDAGKFHGAIYRPFEYQKGYSGNNDLNTEENRQYQQQRNLYDFMRRLLVKRFESSFGAFKQSLENFKDINITCLDFIKRTRKFILDRTFLEKISSYDIDQIETELKNYSNKIKDGEYPKNYEVYEIDKFKNRDDFLKDIESDIILFDEILNKLRDLKLIENDPKLDFLIKKIKEWLREDKGRKIVIFSEYVDTVEYLAEPLKKHFNNRVFVVYGNLSANKIEELNRNFDASYPDDQKKNNYDILLGTDKISEGFNLNRAGRVINYDIPWNPVRVIQRVGRINRISKKVFEEVYISNFFPTEKGAEIVRSKEIAAQKMFLIHNALGEDAKIFDIDEEPTASGLYERIQMNPEASEGESLYTKILKEYEKIRKHSPEIIERIENCPNRVKVAKSSDKDELFVFIRKQGMYIYRMDYESMNNPAETVLEDVLERIRCNKEDKGLTLSNSFWEAYQRIKDYREYSSGTSEQSIEQKALNNIKTLLNSQSPDLQPFKDFLRMLKEDIEEYGTLPLYTLRKISEITPSKQTIENIEQIKAELGDRYLDDIKQRARNIKKDIIIAIENQTKGRSNDRNTQE